MYGMISVLTVGFGVDIFTLLDERGPQPTAWFCVRLERLLPRPTGRPQQLVDEPAFVRQFAPHGAGGGGARRMCENPGSEPPARRTPRPPPALPSSSPGHIA